ncbi:MAG: HEAT repeat domain-containing protein [Planctomycetota bacterium]|nr:HEAT repeat domain-containing protein [Planctomycetota bacterium]
MRLSLKSFVSGAILAACLLSILTLPLFAREDTEESREAYAPIALFFEDIAEEEARGRFYRKALQSIEEYLNAYPEGETADLARFHRAESNWFLGNKVKAEEGWTSVLESSDPRLSVNSHVRLADYFFAEKKYEAALEHFRKGSKESMGKDEKLRCRLHVGFCLFHLDRRDDARGVFTALVADVESGHIAVEAQRYLMRLKPEEEMGGKEAVARYLKDYDEYRKTGSKKRKNALTESIRTNLEDWDSTEHSKMLPLLREIVGTRKHAFGTLAARELIQIGSDEAMGDLIEIIKDKGRAEPNLRLSILRDLVREKVFIDDSDVEAILKDRTEKNNPLRVAAADYIAMRDSAKAVDTLLGEVMIPGDKRVKINSALNAGIRKALARLKSEEAASGLRKIVGDSGRPLLLRKYAISALGKMKDTEAIEVILPLLKERQLDLVSLAAEALGQLGDQRAAGPLLELLGKKPKDVALITGLLRGLDGLEVPDADESLLLSFARSKDHSIRVLAHSLLRQTGGEGAWKQFKKALGDKAWQVRWHAIRAFGQKAAAESIQALIDRLSKEEGHLKYQILKYLHRLTGEDLGLDPKGWKKWWSGQKGSFDPSAIRLADIALGPKADQTVSGTDTPRYFTLKIQSKKSIFVIDISGSMVGEITVPKKGESTGDGKEMKMTVAKRELIRVLRKFRKDTMFNIIWFEARFQPLWKQMKAASSGNVSKAIKFVRSLQPRGATNIFDSLSLALQDPRVDTIYFLSDGEPTAGAYTNTWDILREIKTLNYTRKVKIHTIFLGGTSEFMKQLAEENNGTYIPVAK